jgi:hypothetical protein
MKIITGLLTEWVNIIILTESKLIKDVVANFIAMGILCEIDNMIGESLPFANIEEEVNKQHLLYKKKGDLELLINSFEDYR